MEHTANPLVREVVLEVIEKWDKRIKNRSLRRSLHRRRLLVFWRQRRERVNTIKVKENENNE